MLQRCHQLAALLNVKFLGARRKRYCKNHEERITNESPLLPIWCSESRNILLICPLHEIMFSLPGPVPRELGNLVALECLYLERNQLRGESLQEKVWISGLSIA